MINDPHYESQKIKLVLLIHITSWVVTLKTRALIVTDLNAMRFLRAESNFPRSKEENRYCIFLLSETMIIHTSNCKEALISERKLLERKSPSFHWIAPETVFQGDADVENLYRTDSFRGFKSDTFFFREKGAKESIEWVGGSVFFFFSFKGVHGGAMFVEELINPIFINLIDITDSEEF